MSNEIAILIHYPIQDDGSQESEYLCQCGCGKEYRHPNRSYTIRQLKKHLTTRHIDELIERAATINKEIETINQILSPQNLHKYERKRNDLMDRMDRINTVLRFVKP